MLTNTGTTETITVVNTQGTNAAAIDLNATAGGVTVTAGLAGDAVNLTATNGSITGTAGENAADAVKLSASHATGGVTIDAGATPGITFTNGTQTAQILVGTATPNGSVTAVQGSLFINVAGTGADSLYTNTDGAMAWTAL